MKLMIFVILASTAFGQTPPFAGEWKLYHKLSNFGGFPPPQSATMSFVFDDYGEVTMCSVNAQWQLNCGSHIFNGDNALYDNRVAVKRIGPDFNTAEAVYYRSGKLTTRRWFQVRGNTLTVITNTLDDKGEVTAIVTLVYKKE